MGLFEAVILGIVQGITEFAPISSSAHLVIVPHFFGWKPPLILFLVTLHLGTLVAILCFFRRELIQLSLALGRSIKNRSIKNDPLAKMAWLIIIATIPAGLTGCLLKQFFTGLFMNPPVVGCLLLVTGVVLILSENKSKQLRDLKNITVSDSIMIGLAQSLAIAPGISRSGVTIAGGLFKGLDRDSAARFSFLLSVPVILGAFVQSASKPSLIAVSVNIAPMISGFMAAAVSGYLCIKYLLRYLQKGNLRIFACYCFGLGILTIIFNGLV